MSVSISGDGALTGIDQGLNVVGVLTASGGFSGNLTGNVTGNVTGTVNSSGIATFTSGIVVSAGSTSAPSISPSGDSNTGIFFPSADTIAFAEGGVEAARFASNGGLGIGTNNPSNLIHLYSTSDGAELLQLEIGAQPVSSEKAKIIWRATQTNGQSAKLTSIGSTAVSNWGGEFQIFTKPANGTPNDTIVERLRVNSNGHTLPGADNTYDLGASETRWRNIYTADLQMSNEGSKNDIDGTWGAYTIQEGENDLFLINRRTGKKYKFLLEEVK